MMGRDEAAALRDQLRDVWLDAFLPPPYSETADQVDWLMAQFDSDQGREGFRCSIATDDGRLVGFGCGFRWPDGDPKGPWSKALVDSVDLVLGLEV
jgi:hypothetical protein